MPLRRWRNQRQYNSRRTRGIAPNATRFGAWGPQDGSNNNGYVPYVDYSRDYMPPATQGMGASRESLSRIPSSGILGSKKIGLSSANLGGTPPQTTPVIDPRFSATYGNPYLR